MKGTESSSSIPATELGEAPALAALLLSPPAAKVPGSGWLRALCAMRGLHRRLNLGGRPAAAAACEALQLPVDIRGDISPLNMREDCVRSVPRLIMNGHAPLQ